MSLVIKRVPLDRLHRDPANARLHGEENIEAITASLRRFGQAEPLVVQAKTGRVIGGNGRHAAMQTLGWTECDVVEIDVTDLEATSLGIALNRSAELAEWDDGTLARLLQELRSEDALDGVGFDEDDIDHLLEELAEDIASNTPDKDIEDPGPEPPPKNAVSRLGDLWILGDHRLLCADSTILDDVLCVMGGKTAKLIATDPPYMVNYTGERPNDSGKDWTDVYREIDIPDAESFYRSVFTNIKQIVAPKAALYCWYAHKRQATLSRVWEDLGILDHQSLVWVKPCAVFGRTFWHFRHEHCAMGWIQGSQPDHDGSHEFNSVWEVDWEGKQRISSDHPTSKPVELFARPMRKHTKPGDIVFEPFSGSGSQLIAAEQLNRRCRAIEISPPFVDVALRRWQTATNKDAVLEETGATFEQVARERTT